MSSGPFSFSFSIAKPLRRLLICTLLALLIVFSTWHPRLEETAVRVKIGPTAAWLKDVRAVLEKYARDHGRTYPSLAQLSSWAALTSRTDER